MVRLIHVVATVLVSRPLLSLERPQQIIYASVLVTAQLQLLDAMLIERSVCLLGALYPVF